MNNQTLEYCATRREQIGWRLFPRRWIDLPELPAMRDCIVTTTTAELSFIDRLRVLVSGRIEVQAKTATENVVGATATGAVFNVCPPSWLSRK